jgi:hypothetical protein
MTHPLETPLPQRITRRHTLLTFLGTAMSIAGCGGGGGGSGDAAGSLAGGTGAGVGGATGDPGPAAPTTGTVAGTATPTVTNNQIAVFGDSRTANATQDSTTPTTHRVTADAYIGYAMIASNFRGDFTGAYGVNHDTLQDMLDRLGPTPRTRGQFLSVDPGLSAGIVIFLGGVNDAASPIDVTGPLYQAIFRQLANAGKTVIVCNELPSNTTGAASTEQVARRHYLDSVSIGDKDGRIIHIDTFDATLQPGTANTSKPGYWGVGDGLHPGPAGNRVIGEIIGAQLDAILSAAGYPSRSAKVPTLASQSVLPHAMLTGTGGQIAGEAPGAGGVNRNGTNGAGVTGPVADGWTFARDDGLAALLNGSQPAGGSLTVTLSKGVDADGFATQVITVAGQVGAVDAIYNLTLSNAVYVGAADLVAGAANGIGLADGDTVYGAARIKVSPAAQGLLGPGIEVIVSGPSAPDSGRANLSGTICTSDRDWRSSAAFDKLVLSQPRMLPAGFGAAAETKVIQQQLVVSIAGGVPVDFTVEVSRFGIIKNP